VFQNGVLSCKEPFQALPALSGQVLAAGFKGMVNQWVSICKVALAGTGGMPFCTAGSCSGWRLAQGDDHVCVKDVEECPAQDDEEEPGNYFFSHRHPSPLVLLCIFSYVIISAIKVNYSDSAGCTLLFGTITFQQPQQPLK